MAFGKLIKRKKQELIKKILINNYFRGVNFVWKTNLTGLTLFSNNIL